MANEDVARQIQAHIDWAIRVGVLPRNYRDTYEYKVLAKNFTRDNTNKK